MRRLAEAHDVDFVSISRLQGQREDRVIEERRRGTEDNSRVSRSVCSVISIEMRMQLRAYFVESRDFNVASRSPRSYFPTSWKLVILLTAMVRMIPKGDSSTLPVALIRVASSPKITARLSLARMSWTPNLTGSVKLRRSRMKPATALRPGFLWRLNRKPVVADNGNCQTGQDKGSLMLCRAILALGASFASSMRSLSLARRSP